MVALATDLPQFLHRREMASYEQRLARAGYAYGVDLRRATQLATSMIGDPLMRAVDRRWSRTVAGLEDDSVLPLRKAPPTAVLEELTALIQLLRAPLPTVRLLRPDPSGAWPTVTALGTTKGAIHWLVVDPDRIMALPPGVRTFVLASGLAHLQCDHGPIAAAYLMSSRGERVGLVKTVLRPWAKVSTFSADRAGLLAVQSLDVAHQALDYLDSESVPWLPRVATLAQRKEALADFDHSRIMARRRVLSDPDGGGWNLAPVGSEDEGNSLLRRIRAAFGIWARPEVGGLEMPPPPSQPPPASEDKDSTSDAVEAKSDEGAEPPPAPPKRPPLDPERASRLEQALADAWPLARCDARLTRKLRLP